MKHLVIEPRATGKTKYALQVCKQFQESTLPTEWQVLKQVLCDCCQDKIESSVSKILYLTPNYNIARNTCRRYANLYTAIRYTNDNVANVRFASHRYINNLGSGTFLSSDISLLILDEFDFFDDFYQQLIIGLVDKIDNVIAVTSPKTVRSRKDVLRFMHDTKDDLLLHLYFNLDYEVINLESKLISPDLYATRSIETIETELHAKFIGM